MAEQFILGEQASQKKMVALLEEVRSKGSLVLEQLELARLESLVEFDRRLSALNGRRQRANRVLSPGTLVRFVTSDLVDIIQGVTTATVRADAESVTLRERTDPQDADIRSLRFAADSGTIENLDSKDKLFRVHTENGTVPTGVFDIELVAPLQVTLMVFDIASTPADSTIVVETSANGVSYDPAREIALNGYRVSAWIEPTKVRFVRVSITPSHPDNLNGDTYTFGITSFAADGLDFHLKSELVSKILTWSPISSKVRFQATEAEGLTYFIALGQSGTIPLFVEVQPDDEISIPGTNEVAPVSVGFVGQDWTTSASTVASSPLQLGDFITPTSPNGHRYEVTTAGVAGAIEPTWPTTDGNTVVSGTVVFTCRASGSGTPWSTGVTTLASTVLSLGAYVRPTIANGYVYEVTVTGTTGSSEPSWPIILGNTVVSGGVTFTCRLDGLLNHTLPSDIYINTLKIVEDGSNVQMPIAPGLSTSDANVAKLANKYIGVVGTKMNIVRSEVAIDSGRTYTISYSTGPLTAQAQLKVVLTTEDRAVSPVFRGARLEAV